MEKLIKAVSNDLDEIYSMGYDAWGEGSLYSDYLIECRTSTKYKSGTWYVLNVDGENVSSCILYNISDKVIGIGSLATKSEKRKLGYGALLIKKVLAKNEADTYFLWSDISPSYYEKIGFAVVDQKLQVHDDSKLMYYPNETKINTKHLPNYF